MLSAMREHLVVRERRVTVAVVPCGDEVAQDASVGTHGPVQMPEELGDAIVALALEGVLD